LQYRFQRQQVAGVVVHEQDVDLLFPLFHSNKASNRTRILIFHCSFVICHCRLPRAVPAMTNDN
jgi:hypothetical protein